MFTINLDLIMSKIDTISISGSTYDITSPDFGGLKLVKITQAAYDALTTKDNSTLYVITNE